MRRFPLYIAPCPLSLIVPLRNVPDLPWKQLRRVLPGLLHAQLPLNLADCSYSFARNGKEVVGLVYQKNRDPNYPNVANQAEGVVLAGWALWRQTLRRLPPQSECEKRAILWFGGETQGPVIVTGQGEMVTTTMEFSGTVEEAERILRMAFGTNTEGAVCWCCGNGAEEGAKALKTSALKVSACVAESPESYLLKACAETFLDEPESVIPTPAGEAKRAAKCSRACCILGVVLMVLSAGLLVEAYWSDGRGEEAGKNLDRELAIRVDSVAGYPVAARGDRAVALAKEAASNREPTVLDRLLKAGASARLAEAMGRLAQTDGITLSTLRVDEQTVILSGTASDDATLQAFQKAFRDDGWEVQMERLSQEKEAGEKRRFHLTARRASR